MNKLILLLLAATLACTSFTAPSESGEYKLVTLNERALPVALDRVDYANSYVYVIAGGTLVLRGDRSYTETLSVRSYHSTLLVDSYQTVEDGNYAVSGSTITFTAKAGYSYHGSLVNGNLNYSTESGLWRAFYRKL